MTRNPELALSTNPEKKTVRFKKDLEEYFEIPHKSHDAESYSQYPEYDNNSHRSIHNADLTQLQLTLLDDSIEDLRDFLEMTSPEEIRYNLQEFSSNKSLEELDVFYKDLVGRSDIIEIINLLLRSNKIQQNPNTRMPSAFLYGCLKFAVKSNNIELVDNLLKSSKESGREAGNIFQNVELILDAIKHDDNKILLMLSQYPESRKYFMEPVTAKGSNVAHIAASQGRESVIGVFASVEPEILTSVNSFGQTPMIIAAKYGQVSFIGSMLKCFLDLSYEGKISDPVGKIFIPDNKGNTILDIAAKEGNKDAVDFILKIIDMTRGSIICDHDNFVRNAIIGNNIDIIEMSVEFLKSRGVDIDYVDNNRSTLMHFAAQSQNVDAMIILLNNGANHQIIDSSDKSSIDYLENDEDRQDILNAISLIEKRNAKSPRSVLHDGKIISSPEQSNDNVLSFTK